MAERDEVSRRWTSRSQCTTCGSSTGGMAKLEAWRSWRRQMSRGRRSGVDRGAPCQVACSSSRALEASTLALPVSQLIHHAVDSHVPVKSSSRTWLLCTACAGVSTVVSSISDEEQLRACDFVCSTRCNAVSLQYRSSLWTMSHPLRRCMPLQPCHSVLAALRCEGTTTVLSR